MSSSPTGGGSLVSGTASRWSAVVVPIQRRHEPPGDLLPARARSRRPGVTVTAMSGRRWSSVRLDAMRHRGLGHRGLGRRGLGRRGLGRRGLAGAVLGGLVLVLLTTIAPVARAGPPPTGHTSGRTAGPGAGQAAAVGT